MITGYFGVPRVGKNTMATKIARKALRQRLYFFGLVGPKKYDHVYTDFYCEGCEKIDFHVLKEYKMYNSLIIFEEMALDADNRAFKSFDQAIRDYLVLHGHLFNDIIYLTQDYALVDKKIRSLTQELWYLEKSVVPFLSEFTIARRIFRSININEFNGDLVMGYRFCNFIERFFTSNIKICYRRPYYKYFDSHDEGVLASRPVFESMQWTIAEADSIT